MTGDSTGRDGAGRVNHRELAVRCGVSTATVSRALSGHPHVRPEVRRRVEREAKRAGYRPDPRLGYLSRLRWGRRRASDSVKVVVFVDQYTGGDLGQEKFLALEETADGLGYELEYRRVEGLERSGRRLSREFFHRGIEGLLVVLHRCDLLPEMEWEKFSAVIVGEEYTERPFHRIGTDWRQGFDLLAARMRVGGCRIGLSMASEVERLRSAGRELRRIVLAEVLLQWQELREAGFCEAPIFQYDEDAPEEPARFFAWVREHRLDTLLCNTLVPMRWLRREAQSLTVFPRLFCLPWTAEAGAMGAGGCSLQLGERLSLGLRLLHDNLLLDRRGYAHLPTKTLVPMTYIGPQASLDASGEEGLSH